MKRKRAVKKRFKSPPRQITAEEFYHSWDYIWSFTSFSISMFALFTKTSNREAFRLLQQVECAGYLKMEKQDDENSSVVEHSFKWNEQQRRFSPICHIGQVYSASKQLDSDKLKLQKLVSSYKRLWTSMRVLRIFSLEQLQICSNVTQVDTVTYTECLYQINYLYLVQPNDSKLFDSQRTYRLIRNFGAIPPLLTQEKIIYDLNIQQVYRLNV